MQGDLSKVYSGVYERSDHIYSIENYLRVTEDMVEPTARGIIADIESVVERRPGALLVDVGCFIGAYHAVWRSLGYKTLGVEVNPQAAAYGRDRLGLDIVTGNLYDAHLSHESVDIVVMRHVLEHLKAPGETLEEVHRILRPGGVVFVEVPNGESFMGLYVLGYRWVGWLPDQHFWHFSRQTLGRLVIEAGLVPCKVKRRSSLQPKPRTRNDHLRNMLFMLCGIVGMGDIIIAVARKASTREEPARQR